MLHQEKVMQITNKKTKTKNTCSTINVYWKEMKSLAETMKEINTDRQNAFYARIGVLSLIQYNSSRLMLVPNSKIQGQADFQ